MKLKYIMNVLIFLFFVTAVYAYDFKTIYNPYTGKMDFFTGSNYSNYNISADLFTGNGSGLTDIGCTNIVQDGGGTETDWCNDATGGSGGSPYTNNSIIIFPDSGSGFPVNLVQNNSGKGNITAHWIIGNLSQAFSYLYSALVGVPNITQINNTAIQANNTATFANSTSTQSNITATEANKTAYGRSITGTCDSGFAIQNTSNATSPQCIAVSSGGVNYSTVLENNTFGSFVGFSSSTFTGNFSNTTHVGYDRADDVCVEEYSGSHFCLCVEIMKSNINNDNPIGANEAWCANGPPGYTAAANDCNGWNAVAGGNIGPKWKWSVNSGDGVGQLTPCSSNINIACCGG